MAFTNKVSLADRPVFRHLSGCSSIESADENQRVTINLLKSLEQKMKTPNDP